MTDTITILSLGAGVQSTALALMAEAGMIDKPVAAIFADTGDEPESIHAHLERLRGMLSFPIHTVTEGGGLGRDFLAALSGERVRASQPPFYVKDPDMSPEEIAEVLAEPEPKAEDFADAASAWDISATNLDTGEQADFIGIRSEAEEMLNNAWATWNRRRRKALNQDEGGMLWRACTRDYKIVPIRRKVREIMAEHGAKHVRQQIGISTDERQREKSSSVRFITHVHPLLEMGWSRQRCEAWLWENHGIKAAKSACVYCPYRSNAGWKRMKVEEPEEFERACQFDESIREAQGKKMRGAGIVGQLYVWRGFAPLRTASFDDMPGQMDFGFEQECDGMCGH